MSAFVDVLREIFNPNRDRHAIPSLDGPWQPNRRLDDGITEHASLVRADDIVVHGGVVLATHRGGIAGVDGKPQYEAELGKHLKEGAFAGALASHGDQLAVGVDGVGMVLLTGPKAGTVLSATDGEPLRYPASATFADDKTLIVTEGSQKESTDRYVHDLMKKGASGRVLKFDLSSGKATTLARDLQFPYGVAVSGDRAIVTEAWTHRLLSFSLKGGDAKIHVKNYPGYPTRLKTDPDGGFWLTFFGMRTQLIELVLEEGEYCKTMMETIEPRYWICPTLGGNPYFLEPCQGGQVKQLGITKPWAPPRSYGLVVKLDKRFEPVESFHSRVVGAHHGTTAALEHQGELYVTSKGHGKLIGVKR